MSEGKKPIAEIKSKKVPQDGQKHRSSDNFSLENAQSKYLRWECIPNAGFKVCIDISHGTDQTLYRYMANGAVMPLNASKKAKFYIADPCDVEEDFVVRVYEANESEYKVPVRNKPLNGEDHRASENFDIKYSAIIGCDPDAEFDIKKDIPTFVDTTIQKKISNNGIIVKDQNIYFANPSNIDNNNCLVSISMQSALTTVYKRPVKGILKKVADHTYVVVDDTLYICHGSKDENCSDKVVSYIGDPILSNKLSKGTESDYNAASYHKVNDGNAGIIYLITGVCHQISNRLIIPTGKRITEDDGVNGYGLSCIVYGTYGQIDKDELLAYTSLIPSNTEDPIMQLYRDSKDKTVEELVKEELRIRLSEYCGRNIAIEELPISPSKARKKLFKLREQLDNNEMPYNEILDNVNAIIKEMQIGLAREINDPVIYQKLIGVLPGELVFFT